jgi:hypothetical protein
MTDSAINQRTGARPAGDPHGAGLWNDLTVSGAQGGIRVVEISAASLGLPPTRPRTAPDCAATAARPDAVVERRDGAEMAGSNAAAILKFAVDLGLPPAPDESAGFSF